MYSWGQTASDKKIRINVETRALLGYLRLAASDWQHGRLGRADLSVSHNAKQFLFLLSGSRKKRATWVRLLISERRCSRGGDFSPSFSMTYDVGNVGKTLASVRRFIVLNKEVATLLSHCSCNSSII